MISFKDFLTEARMAPLYHATSKRAALKIVETDTLLKSLGAEPGLNKGTVSLTRNLTFAINWIHEVTAGGGIIFELNQSKLTQRYKIVPYNFFGQKEWGGSLRARYIPSRSTYSKGKDYNFENQFEEAVLSDIKGISKYITNIYVVGNAFDEGNTISNKLEVPIKKYYD